MVDAPTFYVALRQTVEDLKKIDTQIAELQARRASLEITQSLAGQLAITIHDNTCRASHTDQCGWGYDSSPFHSWEAPSHSGYLAQAREIEPEPAKQGAVVTMQRAVQPTDDRPLQLPQERFSLVLRS